MKSKELSLSVKQAIIRLQNLNKPIREIAETLGVAKSTVWYILKKKERTGELSNTKTPGRPHLKEPVQFWNNILWTDETKINLYQNDGKRRVWRREGTAHDPKHTTSSVKHGGGSVMAWACMAANGTGSLVFIDDVTADKSSRMNSEVFRAILSAHIQPNASEPIGRRFTVQMDNHPKHTAKAS